VPRAPYVERGQVGPLVALGHPGGRQPFTQVAHASGEALRSVQHACHAAVAAALNNMSCVCDCIELTSICGSTSWLPPVHYQEAHHGCRLCTTRKHIMAAACALPGSTSWLPPVHYHKAHHGCRLCTTRKLMTADSASSKVCAKDKHTAVCICSVHTAVPLVTPNAIQSVSQRLPCTLIRLLPPSQYIHLVTKHTCQHSNAPASPVPTPAPTHPPTHRTLPHIPAGSCCVQAGKARCTAHPWPGHGHTQPCWPAKRACTAQHVQRCVRACAAGGHSATAGWPGSQRCPGRGLLPGAPGQDQQQAALPQQLQQQQQQAHTYKLEMCILHNLVQCCQAVRQLLMTNRATPT
jgi:hypothetical protein